MAIDLTRLMPAPWEWKHRHSSSKLMHGDQMVLSDGSAGGEYSPDIDPMGADAEFIALARNDLDVKLRRGWHTEKCTEADNQWCVPELLGMIPHDAGDDFLKAGYQDGHDVGLLTKADAWYKANIEKARG